jgi:hypothetical protein
MRVRVDGVYFRCSVYVGGFFSLLALESSHKIAKRLEAAVLAKRDLQHALRVEKELLSERLDIAKGLDSSRSLKVVAERLTESQRYPDLESNAEWIRVYEEVIDTLRREIHKQIQVRF